MLFNTPQYIIFLLIAVLIYYVMPKKVRYLWLLIMSYYFYMQWNPAYAALLFSCTLLTYLCGRSLGRAGKDEAAKQKLKKKICFVLCILFNLGILFLFKYAQFGMRLLNYLFSYIHVGEIKWDRTILLPVGISFYTLQAMGYLIDVYRGEIEAEKNFLRYALFLSFFPQLVAGPIERSKNLLVQLQEAHPLNYENIRKGALLVLYGLFLKMVIADRAAIIVDTVYGNSGNYPGFYIAVATIFFSIQIYCDFYGYSTIARGSALLMGIRLMQNFEAPYFSGSVKEFWRRWHISLSGWFRDYLYIPLGGNRKGKLKKEGNLLAVFAVSGLWHGSALSFIFWGFLNGIYQVLADAVSGMRYAAAKILNPYLIKGSFCEINLDRRKTDCFSRRLFHRVFTFLLVTFAWMFFRAGGLQEAIRLIRNMLGRNNWVILFDGSLYKLGVEKNTMTVLLLSIAALFIVDYQKYKGKDAAAVLLSQEWWFRLLVSMFLIFVILLYGCYGEMYDIQQFIYFQF